jgi:hypothetical protein
MTEGTRAGVGAPADDQMYAVYNLTPNMWEEPGCVTFSVIFQSHTAR